MTAFVLVVLLLSLFTTSAPPRGRGGAAPSRGRGARSLLGSVFVDERAGAGAARPSPARCSSASAPPPAFWASTACAPSRASRCAGGFAEPSPPTPAGAAYSSSKQSTRCSTCRHATYQSRFRPSWRIAASMTTGGVAHQGLAKLATVAAHRPQEPLGRRSKARSGAEDTIGDDALIARRALERGHSATDRCRTSTGFAHLPASHASAPPCRPSQCRLQAVIDAIVGERPSRTSWSRRREHRARRPGPCSRT